jgi:hypothetical protein
MDWRSSGANNTKADDNVLRIVGWVETERVWTVRAERRHKIQSGIDLTMPQTDKGDNKFQL